MKLLPGQVDDAQWAPLDCPYCAKRIAESVAQFGQQVTCPHCHSTFNVKDTRKPDIGAAINQFVGSIIIFLVVFGVLYVVFRLLGI